MSMLTAHFSNLCMTPTIVKRLLGFSVNPPAIHGSVSSSSQQQLSSMDTSSSNSSLPSSPTTAAAAVGGAAAVAASPNLDISPSSVCSSSSTASSSTCHSPPSSSASLLIKNSTHNKMYEKAIRALVKKLRKTPGALDELERAITTRDPMTKCIIVPIAKSNGTTNTSHHQIVSRKTLPHVVYCRIWRFGDLQSCNELKSVPHCQYGYNAAITASNGGGKMNSSEEQMVCINPYHYVRVEASGASQQLHSQHHQHPLIVYVPAKLHNQQQMMDTLIQPGGHHLVGANANGSTIIHDDLMTGGGINAPPSFLHNSHSLHAASVNSPSPPSSASILSPSSIGSNGGMNSHQSQFSPFISEDDASEINSLISPSPPLVTSGALSFGAASTSNHLAAQHQQQQQQQDNQLIQQTTSSSVSSSASASPMDLLPVPMVPQPYWCSISYYEMKQRVGEMFHVASTVSSVTIDGYTDPSSAQRFCLGVLSNVNRSQEVEMTRHYIGRGLMLSYENGQVFAECLSENPVFVQSPNCNQRYNWHLATVVKIPPKCSLKIFDEADFVQVANETVYQGFEAVYALTRICTIRISFVKGWGAEYRRQTILNTPCWIEVHLNNPLKLVDQILTKMGSPRTIATSFS